MIEPSQPAFEIRFEFRSEGDAIRLVDSWKLDTGKPGIVEQLGKGTIKAAVAENLGKLKHLLENGSVSLQDGRSVVL